MQFTISVRFLTGYCVAAKSKTDPDPEWPPHPARLYMALAAAYFEGDQTTAEQEALQWLETLDAPSLVIPQAFANSAVPTYVPANDDKAVSKKGAIQSLPSLNRHRVERMFPRTHLPEEDDTLAFIWSDADEAGLARHGAALKGLCARVGRLGHSMSLVQMWTAIGQAPGETPNLVPTTGRPKQRLRTVARTTGTLERLSQMFDQRPHRPVISSSHGYASHVEKETDAPASVFDPKIEIFRLAPKPRESAFRCLELATTLQLTELLHKAMLKNAAVLGQPPEIISGHGPDESPTDQPHIAYIPIPFVGGQYGDGHLLGFGVVVPRSLDTDPTAIKAFMTGLEGLVQNGLTLGRLGAWSVEEDQELRKSGQMLRPETWTAFDKDGATRWASVTPVAFDQHPKARSKAQYLAESAQLVARMCERIGLPRPSVRVTSVSRFAGVPTAYDFPRLRRKDGSERRQIHVVIEFERKVVGPILIGAGRYRGYGLLKPDLAGGAS